MLVHVHPAADSPQAEDQRARGDALLERAGAGDRDAFASFYDLAAPRVLGAIRRLVIDSAQSEEVAQEAFLQIWQACPGYDPTRGSALGWALSIARRRAVDRIRSAQAARDRDIRAGLREPRYVEGAEEAAETAVERERAGRAMGRLTDAQRQAISLAYDTGYSHSEIAQILHIPIGTVKTRLRDGMMRLRAEMGVAE